MIILKIGMRWITYEDSPPLTVVRHGSVIRKYVKI
jgi:hypothetical protein